MSTSLVCQYFVLLSNPYVFCPPQYIFIHDALLESVVAGNTEVPARNLQSYISQLLQPTGPGDNITGMELEFKVSGEVTGSWERSRGQTEGREVRYTVTKSGGGIKMGQEIRHRFTRSGHAKRDYIQMKSWDWANGRLPWYVLVFKIRLGTGKQEKVKWASELPTVNNYAMSKSFPLL